MLRTIERSKRNGLTRKGKFCALDRLREKLLNLPQVKTRIARKDAMPHERGLSPVPPSEFSAIALADRKTRFCRELPVARASSTAISPDPETNC